MQTHVAPLASTGSPVAVPPPASNLNVPPAEHNAKYRQILDGAREVFLASGFDGASMNDVARMAGVSKGTLYVYFDSKEALFEALIRHDRARQAEQICQFDSDDHNVGSVLQRFGTSLLQTMTSPTHIAHLRTVIGVVPKFPQIGRAFYEAGPLVAIQRLSSYFDAQVESGVLHIGDTTLAAQQFLELCKSGCYIKVLFGVLEQPAPAEMEARVGRAVDAFLRIYSVR